METTNTKKWILIVLAISALMGLLVGISINQIALDQSRAVWRRIPDPPERVDHLLGLSTQAGTTTIAILSQSGNSYTFKPTFPYSWVANSKQNRWSGIKCQDTTTLPSIVVASLPGKMVDCFTTFQWEWTNERWAFALFEDGSSWRWHYHYGIDTLVTNFCGGPLVGLVFGIFVSLWIWMRSPKVHEDSSSVTRHV